MGVMQITHMIIDHSSIHGSLQLSAHIVVLDHMFKATRYNNHTQCVHEVSFVDVEDRALQKKVLNRIDLRQGC